MLDSYLHAWWHFQCQETRTAEAAVTIPPRIAGFSLYGNAIHNALIQYPSIWNKQEIPLKVKEIPALK